MKKKIISLFLVLMSMIFVVSLFGCNNGNKDGEAFEAYKNEQCVYLDSLQDEDSTHEEKFIILNGKNEMKALKWDNNKSLDENKAAVDAITQKVRAQIPFRWLYKLYGQTYDLGEFTYKAEIDTGSQVVTENDIDTESFYVNVSLDDNGSMKDTKYFPESVSVKANVITLSFGDKDVPDESRPSFYDYEINIPAMKVSQKYSVTVEQNKGIGEIKKGGIKFKKADSINNCVDMFEARTITSKSGATVPYRVFEPEINSGEKAPLILWLNTSAETGEDNHAQVGIVPVWKLTTKETQSIFGENGAYIVSTQVPSILSSIFDSKWGVHTYKNVKEALDDAISKADGKVDMNRIYVFGGSLGGMYVQSIVHENPGFFAAAIACAPGTPLQHVAGSDQEATPAQQTAAVKAIADTGIAMYFVHSINDPIANPENGLHGWEVLKAQGGDATLAVCNGVYIEGHDGSNNQKAHETWLHVFNNFNGAEKDKNKDNSAIWISGSGTLNSNSYGTINYESTMPKDAKGNHADILHWLAAHKLEYLITYYDGENKVTTMTKNTYKPNETFTLETPVSTTGKQFLGWYDNPEFKGENITEVSKDKFDKTFYAKWN